MAFNSGILKDILQKEPFTNRVIFGDSVEKTLETVLEFFKNNPENPEKVGVLCKEEDYLFLGKKIRDALLKNGIKTDGLLVGQGVDVDPLLDGYSFFVAIGDSQTVLNCLSKTKKRGVFTLSVPTKGVFADLFTGRFYNETKGVVQEVGLCDRVILDDGIFKALKKKDMADGFSFLLSLVGQISEYRADCILLEREIDREAERLIRSMFSLLSGIEEKRVHGVIFVGQILVSRALFLEPNLIFGGSFFVGKVISALRGISEKEAVNAVIAPLLRFYALCFNLKDNMLAPKINEDVTMLAEILPLSEFAVYSLYDGPSFERIKRGKELLSLKIDGLVNKTLPLIESASKLYEEVYRGRKKRDLFSALDFKKGLIGGGLLSRGVLRVAYDDGLCDLVNEIEI